jgi:transcription elongation factor Elf1
VDGKTTRTPAVVTTFLHQDKTQPPDELLADKAPRCVQCNDEMWLTSVATTISDRGTDGVYTYECKICGTRDKVMRHTDRADGLPVVPEL